MDEPLEEVYFNWLCAKVVEDLDSPIYKDLLRLLHQFEFIPLLVGDHNRAEDGLGVRHEFLCISHYGSNPEWDHVGCSMLEMFIGFSNKASWQTSSPAREWFWKIMENIKLDEFRRVQDDDIPDIEEALYKVVWRTYDDNGFMFPLRKTIYDQRTVEIWYQFCEYVDENKLI